jgi:hypothetical protein
MALEFSDRVLEMITTPVFDLAAIACAGENVEAMLRSVRAPMPEPCDANRAATEQ